MNAIFARPKNRLVSRIAVFQSFGDFLEFCEENGVDKSSFEWHSAPIKESKFHRLDQFNAEISKGMWL